MVNKVDNFLGIADELLVQLRNHRWPERDVMDGLLEAVATLEQEFKGADSIPKALAACFIDLPTALYASVEGLNADDARPLFEYLDQLQTALREICE